GIAALALCSSAAICKAELPAVGSDAPVISGERWYNHIGPDPSLETLKGQAILLEFWATW
ncbi:MAG: hypothetical protein QGI46_09555, partial [Planctomycetota bacterium]|nr:hypothetical protein [Planctomycetota bacterium]